MYFVGDLALPFDSSEEAKREPRLERLIQLHEQQVLRTAYRLLGRMEDARDASQEVFLRLLQNLDRVGEDPRGWLYRVTVNVCNDFYRGRAREVAWNGLDRGAPAPVEGRLTEEERKRLLTEGLDTLTEGQRAAVVLRDIEGLSTREVADAMGIEEGTVRGHISMARVRLAKYVQSRYRGTKR
jgi:RNA polymerase sigma-70 factor, ECF subfamily